MSTLNPTTRRMVVAAILACALLIAILLATGGGFPNAAGSSPTVPPVPTVAPQASSTSAGQVTGQVTAATSHTGHTWHFIYSVRNTGTIPIAGFQLSAAQSNLFHVTTRDTWNFFGSGVCNGQPKGVLVYWSTGANSPSLIAPGKSGKFSFSVNTTGTIPVQYAISWGVAHPGFGTVPGPQPSKMATTGPCNK